MEMKFADERDEHPIFAIKRLQQDGSIIDYEVKFEKLLYEVDILEDVAMNLFIRGLRSDVQKSVINFSPSSLANAISAAWTQEVTIAAFHESAPPPLPDSESVSIFLEGVFYPC